MSDDKKVKFTGVNDIPICAMSLGTMRVNKTGTWRNIKPIIDYEKCTLCMFCWKFCPDAAVDIIDEKPIINYEFCKGCGICAVECNFDAIEMIKEEI